MTGERSNEPDTDAILERHREAAPMDIWRDISALVGAFGAVRVERDALHEPC